MKRPRYRLRVIRDGHLHWAIDRGDWAPKLNEYRWTQVSEHFALRKAMVSARDHLVAEGYRGGGPDKLLAAIDESTALIEGWTKALSERLEAELET